ncbi:hypothetical protein ACUXAV_003756 [Cupriavidus metallidurans]|nr:hypothetical protein AU374_00473 [Cupriavidus metallidurans]
MAVLGLIVHACGGLHKHMFDTREFWSLVLYGRVATQLIGDDLAGAARQERSTRWRKLLAAALSRRFRNRMSSSAPGSSTARYSTCGSPRRLTEVPGVARLGPGGSNLMGNASPESYRTSNGSSLSSRPLLPRTAIPGCRADCVGSGSTNALRNNLSPPGSDGRDRSISTSSSPLSYPGCRCQQVALHRLEHRPSSPTARRPEQEMAWQRSCSDIRGPILGNFGELAPRRDAGREVFAVKRIAQQMPHEGETPMDRPETREVGAERPLAESGARTMEFGMPFCDSATHH